MRDLSNNEWFYKVGLDGERYNFFDPNHQFRKPWLSDNLPLNQNFTWYKVLSSPLFPLCCKFKSFGVNITCL